MTGFALSDLLDSDVKQSSFYKEAVTHRSAGSKNNERLEFLGDAVLDVIVSEVLFKRFPYVDEGNLSRLRSHLVRKETLAAIAKQYRLGDEIVLGPGELKSGGYQRDTILADALEAVLGALFLHCGLKCTQEIVLKIFKSYLDNLPSFESLKDPKTRLQEYLQSKGISLPEYRIINTIGASHTQEFEACCTVQELDVEVHAKGSTKRKAEQATAALVLRKVSGAIS